MNVYIITSGCYSDYGIRGVSLSKKKAQEAIDKAKFADKYWAADAEIECWAADEILSHRSFRVWHCGMLLDDGSIVEPKIECVQTVFEKPFRSIVDQCGKKVPIYHNRPIVRTRSSISQAHANKVAVEARQEWLRNQGQHP